MTVKFSILTFQQNSSYIRFNLFSTFLYRSLNSVEIVLDQVWREGRRLTHNKSNLSEKLLCNFC